MPPVTPAYYATAFLLGALHSFEPAHGKSVMAAYLIGQRRTVKDTVLLALTITVTHTFSVFALAVVAWLFAGKLAGVQHAFTVKSQLLISRLGAGCAHE